jgi:hypothetical protein
MSNGEDNSSEPEVQDVVHLTDDVLESQLKDLTEKDGGAAAPTATVPAADYAPKINLDLSSATTTENIGAALTEGLQYSTAFLNPKEGSLSKDPNAGHSNTKIREKVPKYNKAPCEKIYKGDNNTFIILGRDRNMGFASGYGGKGHTRAGAIDIVVGLQGFEPKSDEYGEKNFGSMGNDKPGDAARIYISQRADIDNYFDICDGEVGNSKLMSAIGIKADSVRIMARRGIKIVTGQAPQQRNSRDGKIPVQFGIDLIAGNRDSVPAVAGSDEATVLGMPVTTTQPYLQPIPKGLNLQDCLLDVVDQLIALNTILSDFMARQMITNAILAGSPILGSAGPVPVVGTNSAVPAVTKEVIQQISNDYLEMIMQQIELNAIKADYLSEAGAIYINSRHNRTN